MSHLATFQKFYLIDSGVLFSLLYLSYLVFFLKNFKTRSRQFFLIVSICLNDKVIYIPVLNWIPDAIKSTINTTITSTTTINIIIYSNSTTGQSFSPHSIYINRDSAIPCCFTNKRLFHLSISCLFFSRDVCYSLGTILLHFFVFLLPNL